MQFSQWQCLARLDEMSFIAQVLQNTLISPVDTHNSMSQKKVTAEVRTRFIEAVQIGGVSYVVGDASGKCYHSNCIFFVFFQSHI